MFISQAYAQAAGAPAGGGPDFSFLIMIVLMFAVMYFLIIRPQSKRQKAHQAMIGAVRRGDTVVTSGGIVGKVAKVIDDAEVDVDIADGVRVRVIKATIADVRSKTEPANDD